MNTGKLYLIPTLIDPDAPEVVPGYVHSMTAQLDLFFVEQERTARRYLRATGYTRDFDSVDLVRLDKSSNDLEIDAMCGYMLGGRDAGILSEAGLPCIADPGAMLVAKAHEKGLKVIPLTGPSSLFLALMASGLEGQRFTFHGYLPVPQQERRKAIKELEQRAVRERATQLFIETPYRNQSMFNDLLNTCAPDTLLCVAIGISGPSEMVRTQSIQAWKRANYSPGKIPAVYLIGRR
jgi:16S rRNA (cytidine1402-2'-O)-methyltransferase